MKPWQGFVHAGVVAVSVWFFQDTIFEALQWWSGRPLSDGLLLGACILLMGLACLPIVALHFSHAMVLCFPFYFFLNIISNIFSDNFLMFDYLYLRKSWSLVG